MIPFTLVVLVAPELLGGVFPWAVAITCVMAGAAGITVSRQIEIVNVTRRDAKLLDWMMVVALGWTVLQVLPLPSGLVGYFVPESVDAWRSNALLYGESARSWIPMSLDPGATRLEIAKGAGIVAVFLTSRVLAAASERRRVLKAVAASAVALALVAFAHKLAGATRVFGIYEPVYASTRLLAPLMNENHLGGFMALTSPILIGLAVDAKTVQTRMGWAVGGVVCALAGVLSFSRGALLALAIGFTVFIAAYAVRLRGTHDSIFRSRGLPLLAMSALAITLLAIGLEGGNLARELSHRHNIAPKLEAAAAAIPVIASHPITGVGRGGFAAAFVHQQGTDKRFFYPENLLVQWASEWGIPVAVGLLLVLIWSIARGFALTRSRAHLGGLAGLVGIGAQQLVDFSLELMGVAVVAAAVLGAVAESPKVGSHAPLRNFCFAASMFSLAGALLAVSLHGGDLFTLERRARAALEQGDDLTARTLVRRGLALHPSEPIFALIGAEAAVREGDASAGRWINRAQGLGPLWSAPHLLAARWLFSLDQTDQALIEIREAEALRPGSARGTICSLLKAREDPAIPLRAAPEGRDGAALLDRASLCLPIQSPAAVTIDASARKLDPTLVGPATRQALRLMAADEPDDAIEILRSLPELDMTAQRILAEAYVQAGDLTSAAEVISPLINLREVRSDVLRTAASIFLALEDEPGFQLVSSRLRGQTGGKAELLAEVEFFLGELYEKQRRYPPALKAYEDSNKAHESRKALLAIARSAEAMGNRERALLTYRRLCRSDAGKGSACVSAERLAKPRAGPP
ncbi:MAG: O-antigen ligase family protein [Polyangiales bacterium]